MIPEDAVGFQVTANLKHGKLLVSIELEPVGHPPLRRLMIGTLRQQHLIPVPALPRATYECEQMRPFDDHFFALEWAGDDGPRVLRWRIDGPGIVSAPEIVFDSRTEFAFDDFDEVYPVRLLNVLSPSELLVIVAAVPGHPTRYDDPEPEFCTRETSFQIARLDLNARCLAHVAIVSHLWS